MCLPVDEVRALILWIRDVARTRNDLAACPDVELVPYSAP